MALRDWNDVCSMALVSEIEAIRKNRVDDLFSSTNGKYSSLLRLRVTLIILLHRQE